MSATPTRCDYRKIRSLLRSQTWYSSRNILEKMPMPNMAAIPLPTARPEMFTMRKRLGPIAVGCRPQIAGGCAYDPCPSSHGIRHRYSAMINLAYPML